MNTTESRSVSQAAYLVGLGLSLALSASCAWADIGPSRQSSWKMGPPFYEQPLIGISWILGVAFFAWVVRGAVRMALNRAPEACRLHPDARNELKKAVWTCSAITVSALASLVIYLFYRSEYTEFVAVVGSVSLLLVLLVGLRLFKAKKAACGAIKLSGRELPGNEQWRKFFLWAIFGALGPVPALVLASVVGRAAYSFGGEIMQGAVATWKMGTPLYEQPLLGVSFILGGACFAWGVRGSIRMALDRVPEACRLHPDALSELNKELRTCSAITASALASLVILYLFSFKLSALAFAAGSVFLLLVFLVRLRLFRAQKAACVAIKLSGHEPPGKEQWRKFFLWAIFGALGPVSALVLAFVVAKAAYSFGGEIMRRANTESTAPPARRPMSGSQAVQPHQSAKKSQPVTPEVGWLALTSPSISWVAPTEHKKSMAIVGDQPEMAAMLWLAPSTNK